MGSKAHLGLLFLLPLSALGCRGNQSEDPPVHWQRNMFTQDKGKAQRENDFFEDRRVLRLPVEGTVSTTAPVGNEHYYTGKDGAEFARTLPVPVNWDLLRRGQDRFNIYCTPCHDRTGSGQGAVITRAAGAMVKPPSYTEDRLREMPVGQIFDTITHGVRTMPSYAYQVPVADRWAIVAYIRALQRSQKTALADVPQEMRSNLK